MSDLLERLQAALADRYTIERELGRGGMAIVYLAEDRKHQRRVALKVLRPELAASIGAERFLREITTAAQLTHPNILPLFDSGETDGTLYYTMPYVEGDSLRDRLNREKQLPIEDALQITREVADALGYAHEQGIVHRDIKPENILFQRGHALVADFGIARAVTAAGAETLTETGLAVGTPAYMSPEQGTGAAELDGRSDLYSLGCVLYEMLAGEPPYAGPTAQAILAKKLTDPLPPVFTVRDTVPPAVEAALAKVLAKNPVDRFATAAEFAAALAPETPLPARDRAARVPAVAMLVGTGLGVLVLTRVLVMVLGLPDWLWEGAIALVGVGVPAFLLGEWWMWGRGRTWLTPRRSLLANGAALAVLAISGAGYLTSRSLGVGPFATPISKGQLSEQALVVLSDFVPIGVDTSDADAVTELLRTDLQQSPVIHALAPAGVRSALRLMRRQVGRLDAETAQEVAQREGVAAVIGGEVRRVGGQYLLLAVLTGATDGGVLASERETARDSNEVIDAAERLSRKLRERIGENLRTIRASAPLWQVTTPSLAALRAYSAAAELEWVNVYHPRQLPLLEEAVAQDTTFAMAYRKLSVLLYNNGHPAEALAAADRAFRFRHPLPEMERLAVEANYYGQHHDLTRAEAVFRRMSELDSTAIQPFLRLADIRLQQRRFVEAEAFARHALEMGSRSMATRGNLLEALVAQRRFAAAESVAVQTAPTLLGVVLTARRDYAAAVTYYDSLARQGKPEYDRLALLATVQGRLADAQGLWDRHEATYQGIRSWERDYWWPVYDLYYRADTEFAARRLDTMQAHAGWDSQAPGERQYAQVIALLAGIGRVDDARVLLAEWKAITPPHPALISDVGFAEGAVAQAEGRPDSAVAGYLRWHEAPFATAEHLFNRGLVEAAGVLDRMGRADSAIVLYERALDLPYLNGLYYEVAWYPLVLRRLGELHESLGHRDEAKRYYGEFIELWKDADPELQPQVEEARNAVARLTAEPRE